jgi:D-cysteine desulfhydrase/L-cysteate sulfo-lyase
MLTPAELRARIARLPRLPGFAVTPTLLQDLPRLSRTLAGPRILVKRDDLTGFAFGGTKVRALEFRLADCQARGCDALVFTNVGQSNQARLAAAACRRLGWKMVLVKTGLADEPRQGNLLLDHLLGAEVIATGTDDPNACLEVLDGVLDGLRRRGYRPYDASREAYWMPAGTISFAEATLELLEQLQALDVQADHMVIVAGSSAAGLALAAKLLGVPVRVHAVSVTESSAALRARAVAYARAACELLGLPPVLQEDDLCLHDEYVGAGYQVATPEAVAAIRQAARAEGLLLDPIYTGRGFAALLGAIRDGHIRAGEVAVFVHTGGLPALFAYDKALLSLPDN